jgi:hypothetical protein
MFSFLGFGNNDNLPSNLEKVIKTPNDFETWRDKLNQKMLDQKSPKDVRSNAGVDYNRLFDFAFNKFSNERDKWTNDLRPNDEWLEPEPEPNPNTNPNQEMNSRFDNNNQYSKIDDFLDKFKYKNNIRGEFLNNKWGGKRKQNKVKTNTIL